MTKADPRIQIKGGDEPVDIGLQGGPVKPITKSWRERGGKRRSFAAPRGGWPEFDEDGKVINADTRNK